MKKFLRYLAALAALAVATSAMAQSAAEGTGEAADSANAEDEPVVSLITCYPGQNIYELYGHTECAAQATTGCLITALSTSVRLISSTAL